MVGSLSACAYRRIAFIVIALSVALLVPDSETYAANYDLLISSQPDRSSPSNLEGSTITGDVYIFTSPESGVNTVDFYLDDSSAGGTPVRSESKAPFDFAGGNTNTASPFDSDQLSEGAHSVTAVLSLSAGGSEKITAYFNVSYNGNGGGGNSPPTISGSPATQVEVGSTYSFVPNANDPDNDPLTFSISKTPSWASFDTQSGALTGAPTSADIGTTNNIVISVSDTVDTDSLPAFPIEVTANSSNSPPVLDTIGDKSVEEGQTLTFVVSATDSNGTPELSASNLPSGGAGNATFEDNGDGTGTFRWVTEPGDEGNYTNVRFVARDSADSSLSDSETIQITVDAQSGGGGGNSSYDLVVSFSSDRSNPVDLGSATLSGDIYVFVTPESDIQRVNFYLDDPNAGGTPVQSESQAPFDFAGGSVNSANPFDSDQLGEGSHSITAVLTLSSERSETITANFNVYLNGNGGGGNSPPVLNPISDKSVEEGQTLTFTVTANDSDGGPPELDATNLPSGNAADATFTDNGDGTGTFRWTTTVGDEGSYNTTFTATDASDSSLSDSETIQITVDAQSGGGGGNSSYDLVVSFSSDRSNPVDLGSATLSGDIYVFVTPESDIQRVNFYLDDPNAGGTPVQSESQAPFDFAGGSVNSANPFDSDQLGEGSHSITAVLTLSSERSETITANFNVYLNGNGGGGNSPPVLNPISDKSVEEGQTLTFTVTANDSDGGPPELDATNLPSGNAADATFTDNGDGTGTFRWTTTVGDEGSYNTTFTATDASDSSLSDSETINITVDAQSGSGGGGSGTLELRVSRGSDDVEESASGSVNIGSSDLELTADSTTQKVGLRFEGLNIPRGVTIRTAYIQFKADESHSGSTSLKIQGQASDNATAFSSTNNNVSSRPRTQASVNWSPVPWTTAGQASAAQRTPNIAPVVQEIMNRSGWSNGNSIALIITGTGKRVAESYNGDQAGAPLLHVEYDDNGSPTVAAPAIEPNGGTFVTSVDITLSSATSGALTYYTLDGTDPDASSTQYSGPFRLTTSATLKAVGILNNTESSVASATFTVTQNGNSPPALSNVGDKSIDEGQTLTFTVQATDPDIGAPPELNVNNLPSGNAADATFTDNGDGTGTFRWPTAVGDAGSYNITFTAADASDSSLSDSETIEISVMTPSSALARTFPGAHWESAQPVLLGVDGNRLDQFASSVGGHGLVVKDGYVVKSWGDPSTKSDWASASKAVISTMLFFAIHEGRLSGVEHRIGDFGWSLIAEHQTMTFHHLANMISGYARGEAPGEAWAYNDYAINLYAKTLFDRVFDDGSADNAATQLNRLGALGFEDGAIFGSRGGYGLNASPRDFARIGWFWLNKGNWNNQQLLPQHFFDSYAKAQIPPGIGRTTISGSDYLAVGSFGGPSDQSDVLEGYGYNWLHNRYLDGNLMYPDVAPDLFYAQGHQDKFCIIIPSKGLVAVVLDGFRPNEQSNLKLLSDAVH